MYRLILPVALLTLSACTSQPPSSGPKPPASLQMQAREVPQVPPPVKPEVLRSIEQLGMPAPSRALSYLELSGTFNNPRTSWQERSEYVLSSDQASGQQRVDGSNGTLTSRYITWRGLFILSGVEQAQVARSLTTVDSVSFRGDWQQMLVGSELGYTTQGGLQNSLIGTLGTEPKVVNCKVASQAPAKDLYPALKGMAKAVDCQEQRPSRYPLPWHHYYYLVDYGVFFHASTDRYDGIYRNLKVSGAR